MKANNKRIRHAILGLLMMFCAARSDAQSQELQQLLLNIEKLTQFKAILSDMKQGYRIYQQGYGLISNLSKGNFNLHSVYLNGLLAVSPAVRNHPRVAGIIGQNAELLTTYQKYTRLFKSSGSFNGKEINYLSNVFSQLMQRSNAGAEDLVRVMTAGAFRMSDDDRLRAVDRIYVQSSEQLDFLKWFSRKAVLLSLSRSKDLHETAALKRLYGIH